VDPPTVLALLGAVYLKYIVETTPRPDFMNGP
jgi:hypothetical protein